MSLDKANEDGVLHGGRETKKEKEGYHGGIGEVLGSYRFPKEVSASPKGSIGTRREQFETPQKLWYHQRCKGVEMQGI